MQRDAPTMRNNDKDFRMFSLSFPFSYGDEKSGTCGPSFFFPFLFFIRSIFRERSRD